MDVQNRSLRRALSLLFYLSGCGPTGFAEIQRSWQDLPGITLSRLLKVMREEGWLEKDDHGRYGLGRTGFDFTRRLLGGLSVGEALGPIVKELALATEESAAYAEFQEDSFVFKSKFEQPASYHYIDTFKRNPDLLINGFGFLCLAHQPDIVIQYRISRMDRPTGSVRSRSTHGEEWKEQKEQQNQENSDNPEARMEKSMINLKSLSENQYEEILLQRYRETRRLDCYVSEEPKGVRFLSPVFKGPQGQFIGVIGISRIIKEDNGAYQQYTQFVKSAAARATKLLQDYE